MNEKREETPIFKIEFDNLSEYELVLLIARRARAINKKRIDLENELGVKLIEQTKPINKAIQELYANHLSYKREKKKIPATSAPSTKRPKTIL